MKKFLKSITLVEWLIWGLSVISIIVSFFAFKNTQYLYLVGSLIGATALIFVSKGNPIGQFLTIVFSVFYGIISYSFNYYGEMITYLGMTAPIALWALISWLRNPYQGNKSQVKVNSLSRKEWCLFLIAAAIITVLFFFILQVLNTASVIISTVSVLTSFIAAYLTARRSRFYAIGYGANDIVLILLWSMASYENRTYLPMVICFIAFFVTDMYGFINWSIMTKKQNSEQAAFEIRHSTEKDFLEMMKIYEFARSFMAEHGNPNQWGPTKWPPEDLIHSDIASGKSYVCVHQNRIVGTFFFDQGKNIELTYKVINDGNWIGDSDYGVIHRLASNGTARGIGKFCIDWAFEQCGHLRIDTHIDNTVMQNLLKKCGFAHCGTIYVEEDTFPRMAFEKIRGDKNVSENEKH